MFNRHSVQKSIKKIIESLKGIRNKTPKNGLLILSGEGVLKVIEPPLPIKRNYYRCDSKFHLDSFYHLFELHNKYIILIVTTKNGFIYLNEGTLSKKVMQLKINLPSSSRRGGYSANRYARIRDEKRLLHTNKILEFLIKFSSDNNLPNLICFGYSDFYSEIVDQIKKTNINIIKHITMENIIDIRSISNDVEKYIRDYEMSENLRNCEYLIQQINIDPDKFIFGLHEMKYYDSQNMIKIMIMYEKNKNKHMWNTSNVIYLNNNLIKSYGGYIGILYYNVGLTAGSNLIQAD